MERKYSFKIFYPLIIIFIIGFIYRSFTRNNPPSTIVHKNVISFFGKLMKETPTITPTTNPAPTPTTIPTPTIPPGFCLHIPVIFYHHVEPPDVATTNKTTNLNVQADIFDSQMKYLVDNGYKTISAEELVNGLLNHTDLGRAAVVTIDDGYADVYQYAYPVAQKYNIILNLMIPTGLLDNPGYLTWKELSEMVNSGTVFAYDHTWSHYPPRGDLEKLKWEIVTAKNQLEEHLGKPVKLFSYPFGTVGYAEIALLQESGFIGAFTTNHSFWQCETQIYTLPRIRIGNTSLSYYGL